MVRTRSSLRFRFFMIFLLMIFIPLAILGGVSIFVTANSLQKRYHAEHLAMLESIHDNIVSRNKEDMERILKLVSVDEDLKIVFDDEQAFQRIQHRWNDIMRLYPERAWIYYGDAENNIIVSPRWTADEDYDLRKRPWYIESKNSFKPIWLDPVVEYVSGEIVITVAMAINMPGQRVPGVLAVDTFLTQFIEFLTVKSNNRSVPILFTDSFGYIVGMNSAARDIPNLAVTSPWESVVDPEGSKPFLQVNGKRYLVSILDVEDLNLKMVSLLPMERITSEIRPIMLLSLLISISGLLATSLAALFLSRSFVSRFERLGLYLERVSGGDYNQPLVLEGSDEFHEFTLHLNNVISKLTYNIETVNLLFHLLSHSISNSIMVVSGKARKMLNEDHGSSEDVQTVFRHSESIRGLIENLLVSHNLIFRGEELIDRKAVDLRELLTEVILCLKERADAKDQMINFQFQPEIPQVKTDSNLLKDVFENLINNAVKFSPCGTDIDVSLYEDGDRICAVVSDQGPGFSADDRKKLFQRNTKLSARPTAGEASHGIGLYLVKQILDLLDGSIELLEREGACFVVSLPHESDFTIR